jgi:hypothetical protein
MLNDHDESWLTELDDLEPANEESGLDDEHDTRSRGLRGRRPLKHIINDLRKGKLETTQLFGKDYDRRRLAEEQRLRESKNEKSREKRQLERDVQEPEKPIEEEFRRRLKALHLAVKYRRGDKLLEQLVGREKEIAVFWKATALVRFRLGRKPTDREVGTLFCELQGDAKPLNKDQARSKRLLIQALEQKSMIWKGGA